jgi:hypothetical protein
MGSDYGKSKRYGFGLWAYNKVNQASVKMTAMKFVTRILKALEWCYSHFCLAYPSETWLDIFTTGLCWLHGNSII